MYNTAAGDSDAADVCPSCRSPEWHSLLRGNIVGDYHLDTVQKVNFMDIGRVVESFKILPYNEQGPCNPSTAVDTCGNTCTTAP